MTDPAPKAQTIAVDAPIPVSQRSLEQLRDEFDTEPTPERLHRVLSRHWYQHGNIGAAVRLIDDNAELVAQLPAPRAKLVGQILGVDRLSRIDEAVPPRSPGVAYTAEPDRVMYCAHSTPAFNSNGYSTRTRGVAAGLLRSGLDVTVVARAGYPWDTKTDVPPSSEHRTVRTVDGVDYVHLTGGKLDEMPLDQYVLQAADAFVREARLQRPSLIHAASNFRTALPALIAARRLGLPFVYEVRGLWEVTEASDKPDWEDSERYQAMARIETLVAREADSVLCITQEVLDELESRGVDRSRMLLAPNAVDPEQFVPLPRDQKYATKHKIRTDVPVIGFAGSVVPYEGLDVLLEASEVLAERGVDHQVAIAGSGKAVDALKETRNAKGLRTMLFLGRLPMTEMPRLFSTFDIMPCPRRSLPVTELVSPLKPLEAFASGKAVVLSDISPHRTLAGEDQERALLVESGSAESLADALQLLIEVPELRADYGRRARLWTLDERTWDRLAQSITDAYAAAREHAERELAEEPRPLGSLRVGVVADEFTRSTLAASARTVALDRDRWREQLESENLDLLFVESAWSGNDGQWHRGVGFYSDDESADLYGALELARELGIPSVFWNKEDPVHFERFQRTAALCDHVFTTDANRVIPYLQTEGAATRTASALPFYAQPAIHNPLPGTLPDDQTVAYAGTYYGDRYKLRSRQLYRLLHSAQPFGLTIYDRQLAYPDSPYSFPEEFQDEVHGVLPYDQVIDSYKSHLAQINVNSVGDSPSMFSRRVVEVAACGGVVLSGPGRGIEETFGSLIPATNDNATWQALLHAWSTDPVERLREAWGQMRAVYRAHTVDTALVLLARTAGLCVAAVERPTYGLVLDGTDPEIVESVARQSVRPAEVFTTDGYPQAAARFLPLGIRVRGERTLDDARSDWLGRVSGPLHRTWAEDLLLPTRFGDWKRVVPVTASGAPVARAIGQPVESPSSAVGLVHRDLVKFSHGLDRALVTRPIHGIELQIPPDRPPLTAETDGARRTVDGPLTVLIAGHDLKFTGALASALTAAGHTLLVDQWENHSDHDEERSAELLAQADVVLCEWGMGNAVWYSKHVNPRQRLVVRVHSQELRRPYLTRTRHSAVDQYVFVGELIRRSAVESHGVPDEKTVVIPNPVDVESLALPKSDAAAKTLGMVGVVAQPKRLDRALDLLELLLEQDSAYKLAIKGRQPHDYHWMAHRPDEMAYYDEQYGRIDEINTAHPGAVRFDRYGSDMASWYRGIGVAISVSDWESFHLTVPDGAASGALPITIDWPGADLIYPREWIEPTVEDMARAILSRPAEPEVWRRTVEERFATARVIPLLLRTVIGEQAQE